MFYAYNYRYYTLTELAPVHYAAVSLHPEMKFEFFEFQWAERPDWIQRAKDTTLAIWLEEYKSSSRAASPLLPAIEEPIEILEPLWRQRKHVRLAAERHDAFQRLQELKEQLHGSGPLEYWVDKRHSLDSRIRDLAAMAIDILSIPAMSSEPERVFSRFVSVSILYSSNMLLIKYCVVQNCFYLIAGTA